MFYLAFRDVFLDRKTVFSVYVLKKKKMKKKGIILTVKPCFLCMCLKKRR